jgi:transporter family protein
MPRWGYYSVIVILLWGVVGLLQKLGANRLSARALLIWVTFGYLILVPALLVVSDLHGLSGRELLIGVLSGLTSGLGAWCMFAALEKGAKASVAVPLTALNPLVTVLLAIAFLREQLTPTQWTGVALAVVAGVLMSCESEEPAR